MLTVSSPRCLTNCFFFVFPTFLNFRYFHGLSLQFLIGLLSTLFNWILIYLNPQSLWNFLYNFQIALYFDFQIGFSFTFSNWI